MQPHSPAGVRRGCRAARDVPLGPRPGERVALDRMDSRPWHFLRDGERDRPRAGPQISDNGLGDVHLGQPVDRPARHDLGLRPRHEHAGPDLKLDVPEVGGAGDVLHRLAGRTPRDVVPEPGVEVGVGHQVERAPGHAVPVRRHELRVSARGLDARLCQPRHRDGDFGHQQAHRAAFKLTAAAFKLTGRQTSCRHGRHRSGRR